MTLIVLESFDGIATADLIAKGWTLSGTAPTVSAAHARTGPNSLLLVGAGTSATAGRAKRNVVAGEHATIIMGAALRRTNGISSPGQQLFVFESDGGATEHITIVATDAGLVEARRGGGTGTLLGTSVVAVSEDTWHYLEAKVTLSDTVGVVQVRLNGVSILSLSNQDTKNSGTKTVLDSVSLRTTGGTGGSNQDIVYWDDFYVANGAGSVNNDFLGDTRVRCLLPNGNGNSSQLLGSDGNSTDNYLLVDEATPSTADYVGSATLDQKDTYAFGDLPDASGTIHGVQISAYATKTDAAARNLAIVTRSDGVDYDGSDVALALGTNAYVQHLRETDPDTAAAWTIAAVNAAEFGAKVR